MKKFPTSVTVAGLLHKIEYVGSTTEVDDTMESDDYIGQVSWRKCLIRILATRPGVEMFDALLHEMLHVIFAKNALLRHVVGRKEEAFITELSTQLADTLVRSKWISLPRMRPKLTKRAKLEIDEKQ